MSTAQSERQGVSEGHNHQTHADKVAGSIELILLQLLVKITAERRHNCATCHAHVQLLPRQAFKKGGETAACPQPTAKGHWLLKSAQKKKWYHSHLPVTSLRQSFIQAVRQLHVTNLSKNAKGHCSLKAVAKTLNKSEFQ
jgi:hypothetical protein